jgi:hypothetical protein
MAFGATGGAAGGAGFFPGIGNWGFILFLILILLVFGFGVFFI